jgi:glycosyltransferase involved in cell wall biosynthesis/GT2 family glycosyltransferase
MQPLVSVIIPCYNYGDVVCRAVKSVQQQTYSNVEIIVVNDGSTDDITLNALGKIKNSGITVVHQVNKGLAGARNSGFEVSKGDFLFFLDNDDILHPRAIELLVACLQSDNNVDFVYSEIYYFGNIQEYFVWRPQTFNPYNLIWSNHPTLSCLIRRHAHESVGGFAENMKYGWEDWEYWLKLSANGFTGRLLELPLYYYWRHGNTMAHSAIEKAEYSINQLIKNNPIAYSAEYINTQKKKWSPVVTIILNDTPGLTKQLNTLEQQTLSDKEIIVITPDKEACIERIKTQCLEVEFIEYRRQEFNTGFNKAFSTAKGEFIVLLNNSYLHGATALEQMIWRRIFDSSNFHFYAQDRGDGLPVRSMLIPDDVSALTGVIIEARLLRFAGGFLYGQSEREAFCDLLLRLTASGLEGRFIEFSSIRAFEAIPVAQNDYSLKYPQLYGDAPSLEALDAAPIARSEKKIGQDIVSAEVRQEVLLDFSKPHYSEYRNKRLVFPSPVSKDSNRKNVLFLIPYMVEGGAEKVDLDILDGLKKAGFGVTLVTERAAENRWRAKYENLVSEIFELHSISEEYEKRIKFLEYLSFSRDIGLIFIRSSSYGYLFSKDIDPALRKNIKIVDLLHAYNRFDEDWIDFSGPYDQFLDERIVISNDLRDYLLEKQRIQPRRIKVFHNGIDLSVYENPAAKGSLRRKLGIAGSDKIIGFLGRVVDDKDPLKWVDVAKAVNVLSPDVHFVVAGDGPLKQEMVQKAQNVGVRNITFIGWQDNVQEIICDFDLLLLTSKNEGLPLVLMEAIAASVQVVAPNVGAIREILVQGFCEILAADATPDQYAASVQRLISIPDLEKRKLAAETAVLLKREYSLPAFQRRYVDKFNELLMDVNSDDRFLSIIRKILSAEFIQYDYRASDDIYQYSTLKEFMFAQIVYQSKIGAKSHRGMALIDQRHIHTTANTAPKTLRSDAEVAEWYHNQYEILPAWYKRMGHLIKVIYGRRSFKSLFNDKEKEYSAIVSVQEWYDKEYEVLPVWYKKIGRFIRSARPKRVEQ